MEVSSEQLEDNKVKLKVEIEPERANEALDQAYKKVVKDVSIPGFRKGKVPRKILEARYGEDVLHKDALDILIPRAYQEAVEAAKIEPVDSPDIEDYYIKQDEPAEFTAVVEVKPEVELGQYRDLGVEKEEHIITEEDVDEQIEEIQNQNSQLTATDRNEVEDGDYVIIDFEGKIDGEPFPGGSAEEFSLEIGSERFIPGFEEQLIGAVVGEEIQVEVSFPEDYQAEDLAGKEAVFDVEVKEIKEKMVPQPDDDFAREVSEFDTIAELRADIREQLEKKQVRDDENKYENTLIEEITDKAEVEISEALIENELDLMFRNLKMSISQQGMDIDDYLQYMGLDEEGWRAENRDTARKRAKSNLVLEKIAEEEGIEVEEEEIESKVAEIASENDQEPDKVRAFLQMQGQLSQLKNEMKMEKTLEFLKENN